MGLVFLSYYLFSKKSTTNSSGSQSGYNFFSSFSNGKQPDTSTESTNTDGDTQENNTPTEEQPSEQVKIKLHKLTDFAVSGATYFEDIRPLPIDEIPVVGGTEPAPALTETPLAGGEKALGNTIKKPIVQNKKVVEVKNIPKVEIVPSLKYVEKVTGHIYQMYLDTKTVSKVSNSTIPAIYEALFDGKALSVIYRYLSEDNKTISSYLATLGGDKGEFLPSNIIDLSLSPDKSQFFYITKNVNGVVGTIRSFGETKRNQVFNSPYSEWLSQWVTPSNIFLTTKASSSVMGNLFSLNTANGTMKKVFGGVLGLTTLANADGSMVLYSASNNSGPELGIFNVSSHTTINLGINSLPEKCVWGGDNIYVYCAIPNTINGDQPDSWYQGLTSFDDTFLKINSKTGELTRITDMDSMGGEYIDATHLFLDKLNTELYFINKKDGTLWSLDLE